MTKDTKAIRVLVAENFRLIREGMVSFLKKIDGIEVVGECLTNKEILEATKETKPDVILMSMSILGVETLDLVDTLVSLNKDVKVLAMINVDHDIYQKQMFKKGVHGCITKNSSLEEMTQAIRAVYNGEKYISPLIKPSFGDKGDFNSLLELLSRRERQILQMLINSKRQKDIAKELNLSPKTVSTYVNRLYAKLKVDNLVDLAKLMLNCGFDEQPKA